MRGDKKVETLLPIIVIAIGVPIIALLAWLVGSYIGDKMRKKEGKK